MLAQHLTPRTKHIWLCHLSEENNHPAIAQSTVKNAIDETALPEKPEISVLRRNAPTGIFILK